VANVHHPGIEVVVREPCPKCDGQGTVPAEGYAVEGAMLDCEPCHGTGHVDTQLLYPGEPFFLLRGKDLLAPLAVSAWASARAWSLGEPMPHDKVVQDALDVGAAMLDWQQANPGLTKTGD
jgi:hypothetical protein